MTRPLSEVAGRIAEVLGPVRFRRTKSGKLRLALPDGAPRSEIREKFWLALAARDIERFQRQQPDRRMLAIVAKAADIIEEVTGELSFAMSKPGYSAAGIRSKKETGVDLVQYRAARAVEELGKAWTNLAELRGELSVADTTTDTVEQKRETQLRQKVAVYVERAEWSQEATFVLLYGSSTDRNNSERTVRRLLEGDYAVAFAGYVERQVVKFEASRLKKREGKAPTQGAEKIEVSK